MSDIATDSPENFTITDNLQAYIVSIIEVKLEKQRKADDVGKRLVSRTQVVEESNRRMWDYGVQVGLLNPISLPGRNSQKYVFRKEYDAFLRHLQIKRSNI